MEENNGRTEQTVDKANSISFDELMQEYNKLREAYNNLMEKARELNNTWLMNRAHFLFEITKNEAFSESMRQNAVKELSEFLYPVNNEQKIKE